MTSDASLRTLYLLRHAKSSWQDKALADFDRPLNKRGLQARTDIAEYMARMDYLPDVILCSTAKRAVMTLETVRQTASPACEIIMDEGLYLADPKALAHRVSEMQPKHRSMMMIGHNPGMHMLALALAAPSATPAFSMLQLKFPTAALCVLQSAQETWKPVVPNSYRLSDFVLPRELATA
jgi:phosphohistidine phosphatase